MSHFDDSRSCKFSDGRTWAIRFYWIKVESIFVLIVCASVCQKENWVSDVGKPVSVVAVVVVVVVVVVVDSRFIIIHINVIMYSIKVDSVLANKKNSVQLGNNSVRLGVEMFKKNNKQSDQDSDANQLNK